MDDRFKNVRIASILGILGNFILLVMKGIVGFSTDSQAMIADFFNSFSDVFSSIMTFIGNKIASIPRDDDHNLGHGKAEYIYSMMISILMIILTIRSMYDSILTLINPRKYTFSIYLIVVCLITIVIKFLLYIYTHKLSKKYDNILIEANSKDHRNDCVITSLNLISCILSLFNIYIVDSIVGLIISFWIFYTAIVIYKKSYDVLMDKSIKNETKDKVIDIIFTHREIKKIEHFNSTPVGYKYQISFTIFVDGNLSTFSSHKIADSLEKEIVDTLEDIYLVVIHVNPLEEGEV